MCFGNKNDTIPHARWQMILELKRCSTLSEWAMFSKGCCSHVIAGRTCIPRIKQSDRLRCLLTITLRCSTLAPRVIISRVAQMHLEVGDAQPLSSSQGPLNSSARSWETSDCLVVSAYSKSGSFLGPVYGWKLQSCYLVHSQENN